MAEVETVFSNDDAFFDEARTRKGTMHSRSTHFLHEDDYGNNLMYDPPSKICGGAVFSKLRTLGQGKKLTNKTSLDHTFEKKDKKTKEYYQQQRNPSHEENSPGLINKLRGKKTEKKSKRSPIRVKEEKTSFKPAIVVPSSITLSSISKSSLSSSPWVTDDDFDDDDDLFHRHHQKTSKQSETERSNSQNLHCRRDLQNLLEEMKDLNCIVQEKSNHLRKGIENIANELQQEESMECKVKENAQAPSRVEESGEEIEKLKQERSFYRSEAETLRMEMKDIKEQLNEIRKILPKMGKSDSNNETTPDPKHVIVESDSDSEGDDTVIPIPTPFEYAEQTIQNIKKSERHSPRYMETIDLPPSNPHSKLSFRNEIREIISNSEHSARSVLGRRSVMRNAEAILQQHHHNHPIRTNDETSSTLSKTALAFSRKQKALKKRGLSPMRRQSKNSADSMIENRGISETEDPMIEKKAELAQKFYKSEWKSPDSASMATEKTASSCYSRESDENSLSMRPRGSTLAGTTEIEPNDDLLAADKKYRQMRRRLREGKCLSDEMTAFSIDRETLEEKDSLDSLLNLDEENEKKSRGEGEVDDEYLDDLRKSWFEKQGVILNASSDIRRAEC